MSRSNQQESLHAIAVASDPLRQGLVAFAVRHPGSFSRDDAAAALEITRTAAAFHLDKLAESGILEVEFRRRTTRVGPGAGRPAKFYRARASEIAASFPERHYDVIGEVLAAAIELAEHDHTPIRVAIQETAAARGRAVGVSASSVESALLTAGYEPEVGDYATTLTNCPFHHLAESHTDTVCTLNHAFVRGVLDGLGQDPERVEFAPDRPNCCVRIVAR
ncbi:MAG TPA: transcriptional regulator [Rhodoglobus sp.]|nr:transcriptional regulator [Rhodoglobus sp.]